MCNRSAAHVSRACRQWLNATPSQIVNRFRMDYASRELSMTDRPIRWIVDVTDVIPSGKGRSGSSRSGARRRA